MINKWFDSSWMRQIYFLGPAFLMFTGVVLIPFALGLYYSLTDWNGVATKLNFVGLDNYKFILFEDASFRSSFAFTVRFSVVAILLTNLLGFTLAYFLTKSFKFRNVLRTVFFIPNVLGGLLLGFVWQFIFVQGFAAIGKITDSGFFNIPWLGTANSAFWGLVIVFVWHGAGYLMVIYIAGLSNVPKDLIQSATIDGAGNGQVLRHITIPMIMPVITVCLFLTISWAFKMFDLNFSLTKGGPYGSTESVAMNIYNEAFVKNHYGLGTAKALIFFVTVCVITAIQVSITRRKEVDL